MELPLQNLDQHRIADLLWVAESYEEVNRILRQFGHDAHVVYNMMIAAAFDPVEDTGAADKVIQQFRLTQ